jgi:hypothetical protein
VEFLGSPSYRELGEDQHLLHDKQFIASQRPRLLSAGLEERDTSALRVDEQRTAVVHDMGPKLRRCCHQHGPHFSVEVLGTTERLDSSPPGTRLGRWQT